MEFPKEDEKIIHKYEHLLLMNNVNKINKKKLHTHMYRIYHNTYSAYPTH